MKNKKFPKVGHGYFSTSYITVSRAHVAHSVSLFMEKTRKKLDFIKNHQFKIRQEIDSLH